MLGFLCTSGLIFVPHSPATHIVLTPGTASATSACNSKLKTLKSLGTGLTSPPRIEVTPCNKLRVHFRVVTSYRAK